MNTQKHAMKRSQEYFKPTDVDITLTVKTCWPIRSLKKHALDLPATLQLEFLKIFTLAGVFKKVRFQ